MSPFHSPYNLTIEEDLEQAKAILERGFVASDIYAAGKLLQSFLEYIEEHRRLNLRYEIPELYDAARRACHSVGIAWTDPRSGEVHLPPQTVSLPPGERD